MCLSFKFFNLDENKILFYLKEQINNITAFFVKQQNLKNIYFFTSFKVLKVQSFTIFPLSANIFPPSRKQFLLFRL